MYRRLPGDKNFEQLWLDLDGLVRDIVLFDGQLRLQPQAMPNNAELGCRRLVHADAYRFSGLLYLDRQLGCGGLPDWHGNMEQCVELHAIGYRGLPDHRYRLGKRFLLHGIGTNQRVDHHLPDDRYRLGRHKLLHARLVGRCNDHLPDGSYRTH